MSLMKKYILCVWCVCVWGSRTKYRWKKLENKRGEGWKGRNYIYITIHFLAEKLGSVYILHCTIRLVVLYQVHTQLYFEMALPARPAGQVVMRC